MGCHNNPLVKRPSIYQRNDQRMNMSIKKLPMEIVYEEIF